MTSSLKNRTVRDSLLSSFNSGFWDMDRSFGLWVYSPFRRSYCFLPFGYNWRSPYGHWFDVNLWWSDLPPWFWYRPNPRITQAIQPAPRGKGDVVKDLPYTRVDGNRRPPVRDRSKDQSDDFLKGGGERRGGPVFSPPAPMPMPMPKSTDIVRGGKEKPID